MSEELLPAFPTKMPHPGRVRRRAKKIGAATIWAVLGSSALAEMETPDALLAKEADYCVVAQGTGDGLVVRSFVFGDPGGQQLRVDNSPKVERGMRAIVYLSQHYDSIGMQAMRRIDGNRVNAVSVADWPANWRASLLPEIANAPVLATQLRDYVIAVQQIAGKARAERTQHRAEVLRSIVTRAPGTDTEEYQRVNALANKVVDGLHADDTSVLQIMSEFVRTRSAVQFSSARGQFASVIAAKYFRPGFDAVRAEAFRNSEDTRFSEQAALGGLSRIGNESDLARLRAEAEQIIVTGRYRLILGDLFRAMGELAGRCYPEGSSKRDEWRNWFEKLCAHPSEKEAEADCRSHAAMALHYVGDAGTIALLRSLMNSTEGANGSYRWAIQDIEQRLARRK